VYRNGAILTNHTWDNIRDVILTNVPGEIACACVNFILYSWLKIAFVLGEDSSIDIITQIYISNAGRKTHRSGVPFTNEENRYHTHKSLKTYSMPNTHKSLKAYCMPIVTDISITAHTPDSR